MTLDELLASPDYKAAAPDDRMSRINEWALQAKTEFPDEADALDQEVPRLRAREYVTSALPTLGLDQPTLTQFRELYGKASRPDSHEQEDWKRYDEEYLAKDATLQTMTPEQRLKFGQFSEVLDRAGKHFQTAEEAKRGMRQAELDYGGGVKIPLVTKTRHDRKEVTVTYPDGTNETFEYALDEPPPDMERLRTFMVQNRREHLGEWGGYLNEWKLPYELANIGATAANAVVDAGAGGVQFFDVLAEEVDDTMFGGKGKKEAAITIPFFVEKQAGPDGQERWVKRAKPEFLAEMPDSEFKALQQTAVDIAKGKAVPDEELDKFYRQPLLSNILDSTMPQRPMATMGMEVGGETSVAEKLLNEQTKEGQIVVPPEWLQATEKERREIARNLAQMQKDKAEGTRETLRPFDVDPSNLLINQEDKLKTEGGWWGAQVADWLGDKAFNIPTAGSAIGSGAPTMGAAIVGGPLAALPFAAMMGASEGNSAYEDVLQRNLDAGVDAETAQSRALGAGAAYAAVATVLEQAGGVFEAKVFTGTLGKTLPGKVGLAFAPEAVEESSQSVAQDLIANANLPEEAKKKALEIAKDALEAGAGALSFGVLPASGAMRETKTPLGQATTATLQNPDVPVAAKQALAEAADMSLQASAEALKAAGVKAAQKALETQKKGIPAAEAAPPAEDAALQVAERTAQPLMVATEDGDFAFQDGLWVAADGSPVTDPTALEAARQAYIQTGDMPEGMQPMEVSPPAAEVTPRTVTPPVTAPPTTDPAAEAIEAQLAAAEDEGALADVIAALRARADERAAREAAIPSPEEERAAVLADLAAVTAEERGRAQIREDQGDLTAVIAGERQRASERAQTPPSVEPTTQQTNADEIPGSTSLPPRQAPEGGQAVREGDTQGQEAPSAGTQPQEVAPKAKRVRSRIARKLTPEQQTMRTRAFKTNPTVENDLVSQTRGEVASALKAPTVVVTKDKGKRKLSLAPEFKGGEWDWYRALLDDPQARAAVDEMLFTEDSAVTLDQAAQKFGMRADEYADQLAAAVQNRLKVARDLTEGKGQTEEDQRMAAAEQQRQNFEKSTAKGKEQVTTWDLNAGDTLDIEGTTVRVKEVDPETGDVFLEDGTRFGRQTLQTGDAIWVEKHEGQAKEEAAEEPSEPAAKERTIDEVVSLLDASAVTPNITPKQLAEEITRLAGNRLAELREALGIKGSPANIASQLIAENKGAAAQKRQDEATPVEEKAPRIEGEEIGERPLTAEEKAERRRGEPEEAPEGTRPQDTEEDAPGPNPFLPRFARPGKTKVLSKGITTADVRKAVEALAKILPNAKTAWVGTRAGLEAYLRSSTVFANKWKSIWQTLFNGTPAEADAAYEKMITTGLNNAEAFTFQGQTYVITDQVEVTEEDATPEMAARRVLIHEDAHEAIEYLRSIDKEVDDTWHTLRNAIPADELDELARTRYRSLKDWRDNADSYDELAEEWFTKKISEIESRGKPAPDSLVGKFIRFLKDLLKRFTGQTITDKALLDFVDAARMARFRDRAEQSEQGIRFSSIDADGNQRVNQALGEVSDQPEAPPVRTRYELMSEDQRREFDSWVESLPSELKFFTQFLGNPTTNQRLRQALGPMIEYARTTMGGIWGDAPAVTSENTERAWEMVTEWLSNGAQFVSGYRKDFQDSGFAEGQHQGDAAAAVLQMELMDYAVRLANETGDTRMMSLLYPYANDMVLSDYATMSGSARNLQVRSQAVREAGVWTALRMTYANLEKRAEQEMGKEDLDKLKQTTDTSANGSLKKEVEADIADKLDNTQTGKAITAAVDSATTPEYDTENYWNRVLRMFEGQERADLHEFWQTLTKLDRQIQLLEAIEQKAKSAMKFSLAQDIAAYEGDPAKLKAEIEASKSKLLDLLGKLTQSDTSSETKDKRRAITRDPRVKRAVKELSATQQARKMMERFENRNKRLKREQPAWRKTFEAQVKQPKGKDEFMQAVQKDGVTEQTSAKLFDLAAKLHTERASKPKADKGAKDAAADVARYRKEIDAAEKKEAALLAKIADRKRKDDARAERKAIEALEKEEEQARKEKAAAQKEVERLKAAKVKADKKSLEKYYRDIERAEEKERKVMEKLAAARLKDQQRAEKKAIAELEREAAEASREKQRILDAYKKITGDYQQPVRERQADLDRDLKEGRITPAEHAAKIAKLAIKPKATNMADTKAFLSFIADQITGAPITLQEDPAWKRLIVVNALKERGMSQTQAEDTATKLVGLIDKAIKEGQSKAAIKALKTLKKAKKIDPKKLGEAIRTRGLDPLNPHPVVRAIAEQLGYNALSPTQFRRLAELDQLVNDKGPTLSAKAYNEIDKILATVRPDKTWHELLSSSWVYSALSSTGVAFLNWINPLFVSMTSIGTQLASVSADIATRKVKPLDGLTMIGQSFANWVNAMSYMGAEAAFALKNDAYANKVLEMLNASNRMHQDMMKALEKMKTGTPKEKVINAVKFLHASTDLVRRSMASADQMWGGVLQQYIIQNEAMRQLVTKAGLSAEAAAAILNSATQAGQKAQQDHMATTKDRAESVLVGKDALQQSLSDALTRHLGKEKSEDVNVMASKEAAMELGNRLSESGGPLDLVNGLMEMLKLISNSLLRKYGLNARVLTGFITVAANILNRSAYFSPVGIARALYKMDKLPDIGKWLGMGARDTSELYKQTMATDGQTRMRLIEGVVGTLAMVILMALRKDSDDEEGFVMTGEGPPEPKDKEAWLKMGHKPSHFEWVGSDGRVKFSIPFARGGFDNLAFPMTFVGALDDLQLQRKKLEKKNARAAWLYGETVVMNLSNQARFFGMRNLVNSVPTSLKEGQLAKSITYSASPLIPWSGLAKSMTRLVTGQQDQSSVNSAVMANLPIVPLVSGRPARNFLGDAVGPQSASWLGKAGERLHIAGIPIFVDMGPGPANEDVYRLLVQKGVSPSIPMRSTIESSNGQITDNMWERYVVTRGGIVKDAIKKDRHRIQFMTHEDAQEHMESLSRDATKATKKALGLK